MTVTAEIQITDRAQSHIMEQLKKSGSSSLRLGVKESGCNGFMYTLDYLTDTSVSDFSLFERSDLSVCAHEEDLALCLWNRNRFSDRGTELCTRIQKPQSPKLLRLRRKLFFRICRPQQLNGRNQDRGSRERRRSPGLICCCNGTTDRHNISSVPSKVGSDGRQNHHT